MKIKGILRFYFSVESLESAFEKLILARACLPFADADKNAEKIFAIIESKKEIGRLWLYVDSVICGLRAEERARLCAFAERRADGERVTNAEKNAVVKFTRRASRLKEFYKNIETLKDYYALISEARNY